jgi:cytochrome c biogenesis protein CcmG/thiol:disulfide interchange protein DsbE
VNRLNRFVPLVLFLLLAVMLMWGLDPSRDTKEIPSPLINKSLPNFSLPDLMEPNLQLTEQIFHGKVTLLNVWGSWCVVCVYEHPFLRQLAGYGVNVVGMNYRDEAQAAREWIEEHGNPYEYIIADFDGSYGIDLGVYGAPETFLIDKQGVVRFKHVGPLRAELWRSEIAPLYQQLKSQ